MRRTRPARSLVRKAFYYWRNVGRLLRGQSTFKVVFIACFALGFELGLFFLFRDGFQFLSRLGGVGTIIISRLFSIFFLGMGMMLVISSVVTSYASFYRSPEVAFLLVRPYPLRHIVVYKLMETAGLASWAFVFIIFPFVTAYAMHEKLSILFALWTLLFSVPFLLLCSAIGVLITMFFVRLSPSERLLKPILIGALLLVAALLWPSFRDVTRDTNEMTLNLSGLVPGLRLATNRLTPGYWMSEGILCLTKGQWSRGLLFWGVILSNALLLGAMVESLGTLVFFEGWQRAQGSRGRTARRAVVLNAVGRLFAPLPSDVRAMLVKDVKTFFRDPVQWSQALIFFGLLAFYFANLRTFRYHALPDSWRNIVAFLNVFSVSAVMCSLGSRFIFPQLSLEGHGFWIVGLSPMSMTKVLLTKFGLAVSGMLLVSVTLMLLSSGMLDAIAATRAAAVAVAAAISFAVCGLSVGLGAVFIDLNQRNPAAIVSGFGGTLNLVLSLSFMLASIVPFGFLFHLHFVGGIPLAQLVPGFWISGIWLTVITVITTWIPLYLGKRTLQRREF